MSSRYASFRRFKRFVPALESNDEIPLHQRGPKLPHTLSLWGSPPERHAMVHGDGFLQGRFAPGRAAVEPAPIKGGCWLSTRQQVGVHKGSRSLIEEEFWFVIFVRNAGWKGVKIKQRLLEAYSKHTSNTTALHICPQFYLKYMAIYIMWFHFSHCCLCFEQQWR